MGTPRRTTAAALAGFETDWDRAVDRTPGADAFCSSTLWSFAAAESFPAAGSPTVVSDGVGFCGLREATSADGTDLAVGLDPVWGFATPCVGPPSSASRALAGAMAHMPRTVTVVGGQRRDSALTAAVVSRLEGSHRLLVGATETRLQADLSDGFDAWLARRSSRFRRRMRSLENAHESLEFVELSAENPDTVMERILAIEASSWKGEEGTGLASEDLAGFYRAVAWRLSRRDGLRAFVAVDDGIDVGFILGGVRGTTYRGLQLSYTTRSAHLGVGHRLQLHQLRAAAREGLTTYDLGMDMEYKRRWADRHDTTFSLLAVADG